MVYFLRLLPIVYIPDIVSLTMTETIFGIGILFWMKDLALCRRSLVVASADLKYINMIK